MPDADLVRAREGAQTRKRPGGTAGPLGRVDAHLAYRRLGRRNAQPQGLELAPTADPFPQLQRRLLTSRQLQNRHEIKKISRGENTPTDIEIA